MHILGKLLTNRKALKYRYWLSHSKKKTFQLSPFLEVILHIDMQSCYVIAKRIIFVIVLLHKRTKARLLVLADIFGMEMPPSTLSSVWYLFLQVNNHYEKELIQVSGASHVEKNNLVSSSNALESPVAITRFWVQNEKTRFAGTLAQLLSWAFSQFGEKKKKGI